MNTDNLGRFPGGGERDTKSHCVREHALHWANQESGSRCWFVSFATYNHDLGNSVSLFLCFLICKVRKMSIFLWIDVRMKQVKMYQRSCQKMITPFLHPRLPCPASFLLDSNPRLAALPPSRSSWPLQPTFIFRRFPSMSPGPSWPSPLALCCDM